MIEKNISTSVEKNRVLVIGINTNSNKDKRDNFNVEFLDDLEEMKNLITSCDMEVIDNLVQNLDEPNPRTYVGSGKIEEIKMAINSLDIDTIVCNDELSPAQIENLEDALEITVYDRTYIILEIFKRRAKTKEAILQVEIASLKYMLPRLAGMRKGLSRQGGGRNKGKGETKLELDRRHIEYRISMLKDELATLTQERKNQRVKRKKNNMLIVSLVGYTNSGKSSTMNAILKDAVDKQVFEKDMLFATLETSTRLVKMDNKLEFLLTDTVGFVNKLPHTLVEAFKSTLEEITESDLIVHVVDASNGSYQSQIAITENVIKEIGASDIPTLYAFNKMDKVEGYFFVPSIYENAVRYSAKDKSIKELLNKIEEMLYKDYHNVNIILPYDKSSLVNTINQSSKVYSIKYEENIIIEASVSDYLYNYLHDYIKKD